MGKKEHDLTLCFLFNVTHSLYLLVLSTCMFLFLSLHVSMDFFSSLILFSHIPIPHFSSLFCVSASSMIAVWVHFQPLINGWLIYYDKIVHKPSTTTPRFLFLDISKRDILCKLSLPPKSNALYNFWRYRVNMFTLSLGIFNRS